MVLKAGIDEKAAKDMVWRRETNQVGDPRQLNLPADDN
jgi:hypothetical protein